MRILLLLFLFVSATVSAQPVWKWATHLGGAAQDRSNDIAVDPNGNVITTGWFFGTTEADGFSSTSAGHADAFLAKHDAQGTCLWLVGIGESSEDRASKVVVDGQGAIYVAGTFRNTLVLGVDTLVSYGGQDISSQNLVLMEYPFGREVVVVAIRTWSIMGMMWLMV